MTIKEAILKSLEDLHKLLTHNDIYEHIIKQNYYNFGDAKTPASTISALLGDFIRKNDTRVKRIAGEKSTYLYYLAKFEQDLNINEIASDIVEKSETKQQKKKQTYNERDLHKLLSSYLKNKKIYAKTILHEESKNSKDDHQKWIHPDMIAIEFLNLTSKVNKAFMKILNKSDTFKLTSYEIKKEINTDYELKKYYFQAVSNSSWANYGYLVALEINDNLKDEMQRLNESFGIGIIELKSNPYESKILFQAKFKELDFKTIDKLCKVNEKYENFIELTERMLTIDERNYQSVENELGNFCDEYFENDSEIKEYCRKYFIPYERDEEIE
ncbi:protein of unknown function DUF511 [Arcobacter nitrofigilis DSM 7299]|uniref:HTH HARE-type domain-containing protein n=1 Tax=Arcobacter nitrofigilis (strain ATCC 33309 / DSM 7299 / CCUG 15893 / LMG 7604 / NCTC 12251 / CI) TaxID=572480 RepID=D5V386_ARCNC|nr:HTH domain-containing protein [Arcobacter nitrofigilis]ADG92668.1 protein of unknown function DUF511 [Arcobacter nitrofigilis DSM 7299]